VIQSSVTDGAGKTIRCHAVGTNTAGEIVSEFWITWSFKAKQHPTVR